LRIKVPDVIALDPEAASATDNAISAGKPAYPISLPRELT
jgi:hypothetical protein